jgi:hypothetical protein
VNYTNITIKKTLKIGFLLKTPETKKFVKIFCEAFFYFTKYILLQASRAYLRLKKNYFRPPVVHED